MGKSFKIQKYGSTKDIANAFNNLNKAVEEGTKEALMKTGLKGEQLAVKHMKSQDLGWQPLDEKYLARKKKQGESNKVLIASTTYLQSITSVFQGNKTFVGVKRDAKAENGESLVDIAYIHEFGSIARNITRRPLWQPVLKELRQFVKKSQIFKKSIKK